MRAAGSVWSPRGAGLVMEDLGPLEDLGDPRSLPHTPPPVLGPLVPRLIPRHRRQQIEVEGESWVTGVRTLVSAPHS